MHRMGPWAVVVGVLGLSPLTVLAREAPEVGAEAKASAQASGPLRVAVRAARLFDGKNAKALTDAVVLIEANRIKAVGSGLSIPEGTRVIDLGDVTLLPGLIDAHSHLLMSDDIALAGNSLELNVARMSTAERALLGVKLGRELLEVGITTVRDVGNSGVNGDVALRNAIQRGCRRWRSCARRRRMRRSCCACRTG